MQFCHCIFILIVVFFGDSLAHDRYVVPFEPSNTGNCTNTDFGDCSLEYAIDQAFEGDTIILSSGIYDFNGSIIAIMKSLYFKGDSEESGTVLQGDLLFDCKGTFTPVNLHFQDINVRRTNSSFIVITSPCEEVTFERMIFQDFSKTLIVFNQYSSSYIRLFNSIFRDSTNLYGVSAFIFGPNDVSMTDTSISGLEISFCQFGPNLISTSSAKLRSELWYYDTPFGSFGITFKIQDSIFLDSSYHIYGDGELTFLNNNFTNLTVPEHPTTRRSLISFRCTDITVDNSVFDLNSGSLDPQNLFSVKVSDEMTPLHITFTNTRFSGNSGFDSLLYTLDSQTSNVIMSSLFLDSNTVLDSLMKVTSSVLSFKESEISNSRSISNTLIDFKPVANTYGGGFLDSSSLDLRNLDLTNNEGCFSIKNFDKVVIEHVTISASKGSASSSPGFYFKDNVFSNDFQTEVKDGDDMGSFFIFEHYCPSYLRDVDYYRNSVTMNNCSFLNNQGGYGPVMIEGLNTMNISNCIFLNNSADYGAGIYVSGSSYIRASDGYFIGSCDPSPRRFQEITPHLRGYYESSGMFISNCDFSSNIALEGGGIMVSGKDMISEIKNCKFSSNSVREGGSGGDIYFLFTTDVKVKDCVFNNTFIPSSSTSQKNNFFDARGAIELYSSDVIIESSFISNTHGCGIFSHLGSVEISNTTIEDSSSGGIAIDDSRPRQKHDNIPFYQKSHIHEIQNMVFNSTIQRCTSVNGGGLLIRKNVMNEIQIQLSTIKSNEALFCGGGVFIQDSSSVVFSNNEIVNNMAPVGSGLCTDTVRVLEVSPITNIFSRNIDEIISSEYFDMTTPTTEKKSLDLVVVLMMLKLYPFPSVYFQILL